MPIEFNCSQCRHRLRTPDDSAGKQSRCPQCGHIEPIPHRDRWGAAESEVQPKPPANPFDANPDTASPNTTSSRPADNPFADAVRPAAPNPYAAPIYGATHAEPNRHAPIVPGALLIAVAVTSIILLLLALIAGVVAVLDQGLEEDDVLAFVFLGFTLAVQLLIVWGGVNMVRRRGYNVAMAGAIAAIVPISLCWCLDLPIGLWSLAVLSKDGMRSIFTENQRQ